MEQSNTPAQHTPGPWRHEYVDSLLVLADPPTGERIIAGCWGHSDQLLAEGVANARLIAAAPNLLASLTWAVEWMEHYEGECMPEWREWQQGARAVLDAAKGAQP